jgi:hypothetical protein
MARANTYANRQNAARIWADAQWKRIILLDANQD